MKVCVDAGHGMGNVVPGVFDSGAIHVEDGSLFKEADIALEFALALKDTFQVLDVDVFMTRDDATDPAPVKMRATKARNAGCDALISLHLNDHENDSANGLEVLFRDDKGKALAQKLQDALVSVTQMEDRGIKPRPELAVLKFQGVAALVELGFIANDGDRKKLLDPQVRAAIVQRIAAVTIEHTGGN
jgi:N-acetylmuramoyl-L-alanine amidase